ncbi:hypothetical protein K440DRAFT_638969 [Wilcoxina mikolae CBS 423.85]|nr:hypothetical protein K440DRAFT_638969 [Wilcoxina mikolae CBS 423.85]
MRIIALALGLLVTVAISDRNFLINASTTEDNSPSTGSGTEGSSAGHILSPRAEHPSGKPWIYPNDEAVPAVPSAPESHINATRHASDALEVKRDVPSDSAEAVSDFPPGFNAFVNDEAGAQTFPIPKQMMSALKVALKNATDPADVKALKSIIGNAKFTLKCETSGGSPLMKDVLMCAVKLDQKEGRCRQTNPGGSRCTTLVTKDSAAVSICEWVTYMMGKCTVGNRVGAWVKMSTPHKFVIHHS